MNKQEYELIYNNIVNMSYEIRKVFNRNERLAIANSLLDWLQNNGGCVLIKEDEKKLKTKNKTTYTYMTKWGIKFQVIKDIKYYKIHDVQIKLLTKQRR